MNKTRRNGGGAGYRTPTKNVPNIMAHGRPSTSALITETILAAKSPQNVPAAQNLLRNANANNAVYVM
tara:strand:- start:115 stop:318 length:204 start_codon:yes stop_codon:yes gene_type:complete